MCSFDLGNRDLSKWRTTSSFNYDTRRTKSHIRSVRSARPGNTSQAKDAEADRLIRSKVAEIPASPYLLVQSILVMQQALSNAQLESRHWKNKWPRQIRRPALSNPCGSFLAGVASLFGGGQSHAQRTAHNAAATARPDAHKPAQPQSYGYPPPVPQQPAARGGVCRAL